MTFSRLNVFSKLIHQLRFFHFSAWQPYLRVDFRIAFHLDFSAFPFRASPPPHPLSLSHDTRPPCILAPLVGNIVSVATELLPSCSVKPLSSFLCTWLEDHHAPRSVSDSENKRILGIGGGSMIRKTTKEDFQELQNEPSNQ